MTRRLIPWTTTGLLVLACSSGETPNDSNGAAGTGTTPSAGTQGAAGSSSGSAGKATAGAGGSAGTGAATGGTAGTTMPGAGRSGAGAAGSPGGAGPSGGAGGATPTAGTTGNAGATGAAGAGGAGSAGMAGGPSGGAGSGGAPAGGMGGMGGSGSSTKGYTCNQVIGIDSTSEWYTGGFENQVPNDKWQIIYHHPGYVEDWADLNDEVWTLAPTSACTMNSTNPDRVIFNIYSETLTTTPTLVTALNKAIANFKSKYSRLQRIDILTMTRAPNNTPCVQGNNGSIVQQYVDDAVAMVVSAGPPPIIASPKFFATDCNVFDAGGPHFSTTGKPIVAKIYGDYYLAEP